MKITLITVGKIKEKYLKDAIAEYSKRLSKYCKLDIIEVPDEKTPDQASETVEEGIRSKEGEKILRYIKDDMYVITLEIAGKMLTSEELAERIEKLGIQGKSSIAFVIGGSFSFSFALFYCFPCPFYGPVFYRQNLFFQVMCFFFYLSYYGFHCRFQTPILDIG